MGGNMGRKKNEYENIELTVVNPPSEEAAETRLRELESWLSEIWQDSEET